MKTKSLEERFNKKFTYVSVVDGEKPFRGWKFPTTPRDVLNFIKKELEKENEKSYKEGWFEGVNGLKRERKDYDK